MGKWRRARQQTRAHEGRPIDSILKAGTLKVETPYERHSIRDKEIEVSSEFRKPVLMAAHRHDVSIGKVDGGASFLRRQILAESGKFCIIGNL